MKHFLLILLALSSGQLRAQNQWTIKDSVNGEPRSVASSFVVGGEGYALCGLDLGGFRRKLYSYTFWQDDWDNEGSLGGDNGDGLERGSASAFAINDKGYMCLGQGYTNPFFKDLWEYDPLTNAWTQKASFIGSARRQAVGFAIDSLGYVGLGYDANGYCKDMYKYSPATNSWVQLNDFGGTARKEAVGFAMGGQGYVGTGDDGVLRNDFWQYEPTTDTWTQKPDFPGTPRKGAAGWGIFPQAFITTGEDINNAYPVDLWEYSYFSDSWVQRADFMGPGRSNAIAFVLQDNGFVGTGYGNSTFMKDMYAYRRILDIDEQNQEEQITVYPNPSADLVHVQMHTDGVDLQLYSPDGKQVHVAIESVENGFTVHRGTLESGNYLLVIRNLKQGTCIQRKIQFL